MREPSSNRVIQFNKITIIAYITKDTPLVGVVYGCGVGNSEVPIERLNSTEMAIFASIIMGVGPTRWGWWKCIYVEWRIAKFQ